jgi:hypothetical protein
MDNCTQLDNCKQLDNMAAIWENLPCALSERICNTLPQVRKVDENLKRDIEDWDWGRFMEFKKNIGNIDVFFTCLNVMNEENGPVFIRPVRLYSLWCQLTEEERARILEIGEQFP